MQPLNQWKITRGKEGGYQGGGTGGEWGVGMGGGEAGGPTWLCHGNRFL